MKGTHLYLFAALLMLVAGLCKPQKLMAQEVREIKGTVLDSATQAALPGVTVFIKGTQTGASTNAEGHFTIRAASGDVLSFSYIGYDKKETAIGNRNTIFISLPQSKTTLNETVVIGYGAVKKSSVTASVAKVENKILDQVPAGRPEAALVGRMAGVNISQSRGQAGSAPTIRIRGIGSISAGNDPLIVIDGIPGGNLGMINMNDVQSVEVLKDASSAAIYGSRAAGGVILVTMKKGVAGKPKFNFNGYAGLGKAIVHNDWITGDEYYNYAVKYQNREYGWVGGDVSLPVWGDARRPAAYQVSDVLKTGHVVWQDAVMRTAPIQSYNISASGGTDKATYYVAATYKDEQGSMVNTWFKTYGIRANVDVQASKVVSVGFMLNPTYSKRRYNPSEIPNYSKYPSFVDVQRPNGTYPNAREYWGAVVTGQVNPMATLQGSEYYGSSFSNIGEAYLKLNLAKGLSFRSSVGTTMDFSNRDEFQASWATSAAKNSGTDITTNNINILNENVLSYNTTFKGGHDLSAIAGASYQRNDSKAVNLYAVAGSYNNDIVHTMGNATLAPNSNTVKSKWGLISYFTRVNYGYKDKYLLSASIRTDASSRFGPDNRWGYFPSVSAAWRVKQESFLKDFRVISDLKLRASWGVTGNFNIGDFQYLGLMGNTFYSPGNVVSKGQAAVSYGNSQLGWEKTKGIDLGGELSVLDNRISIVFDYYDKRTTDLLYSMPVPATTGFGTTMTNIGEIRNRGIEFEVNTRNIVGKFNWQTSFNYSRNRNTVEDLGGVNNVIIADPSSNMNWILRVGEPMFSYYGYKINGIYKDAADVAANPGIAGSRPGNPKFEDTDGNKKIDANDKQLLGNFQPKAILGMVNNFSYNNFDLSIAMQASLGAKMYNYENQFYQGALLGAMRRSLVENQWWSPSDPGNGKVPASALNTLGFQTMSDAYIEDASFLAIRNVNLGYTLPETLIRKLRVTNFRVYLSASNLFIFTKKEFHGYNPEGYTKGEVNGVASMPGANYGAEPISRIYALGFNFNF